MTASNPAPGTATDDVDEGLADVGPQRGVNPDTPLFVVDEPDGYVYHYTSAAGLTGIINSRSGPTRSRSLTFFASDLLEMNDVSELAFGLYIAREHVERLAADEAQPGFFNKWIPILEKYLSLPSVPALLESPRACVCATSFTTSPDLLSQWVTYGAGGGFAIGLDASTLRTAEYTGHNVRTMEARTFKSALTRVYYGDEARERIDQLPLFKEIGAAALPIATVVQTVISAVVEFSNWLKDEQRRTPPDVYEHAAAAMAISMAAQYKHDAFQAEREWRLLVGGGSIGDLAALLSGHYPPDFRAAGGRLIPYRTITIAPTAPEQPVVRDLVVGPAPDQAQLVHAAQQLLIANGHDPSVVRVSEIPYRGW